MQERPVDKKTRRIWHDQAWPRALHGRGVPVAYSCSRGASGFWNNAPINPQSLLHVLWTAWGQGHPSATGCRAPAAHPGPSVDARMFLHWQSLSFSVHTTGSRYPATGPAMVWSWTSGSLTTATLPESGTDQAANRIGGARSGMCHTTIRRRFPSVSRVCRKFFLPPRRRRSADATDRHGRGDMQSSKHIST